jgi:hypothetical protein
MTFFDKEGVPELHLTDLPPVLPVRSISYLQALPDTQVPPRRGLRETLCYKLLYKRLQDPGGRPLFEAERSAFRRFLKKSDVTTGYTSQNDLPVTTVKKNPLKRLFLTETGKEKWGYL